LVVGENVRDVRQGDRDAHSVYRVVDVDNVHVRIVRGEQIEAYYASGRVIQTHVEVFRIIDVSRITSELSEVPCDLGTSLERKGQYRREQDTGRQSNYQNRQQFSHHKHFPSSQIEEIILSCISSEDKYCISITSSP